MNFPLNGRKDAGSAQKLASASNVATSDLVPEVRGLLGVSCELHYIPKRNEQTVSIEFLEII